LYRHYLAQQEEGRRLAWVAEWDGELAGYVTLLWTSAYSPFADRQVPEVADLAVLPGRRRQGIGSALLGTAESAASARSTVVGIGVGLYSDYGAVQRIYARRGYLPDGRGIMYQQPAGRTGRSRPHRRRRHSHAHPAGRMTGRSREPAHSTPRARTA